MDATVEEFGGLAPIAGALTAGIDLLPGSPFRPLDWRWQRAGQLQEGGTRRRRWDDDWVVRCRGFLADLSEVGGDLRHLRLARAHPQVLGAYHLYHRDRRRRLEIEARLLAGQADQAIAERVGVTPDVVGTFEALFYCVRDRLGCPDWLAFTTIGPRLYEGINPDDLDLVWKVFAINGGPMVLDALIENDGRAASDPELDGQLDRLITAMTTRVTPENAPEWIRLDAQLRQLDRAEAARGVAAVSGPIVVSQANVPIGPATVRLEHAGGARNDTRYASPVMNGEAIELSAAG